MNCSTFRTRGMARLLPAWLLLLLYTLPAAAHSGPQPRFTISVEHTTIEKVFQLIEKQSTYRFLYDAALLQQARPVSLHEKNSPLESVLNDLFKNQPFSYRITENMIVVTPLTPLPPAPIHDSTISGQVLSEGGQQALAGATITLKGSSTTIITDATGRFSLVANTPGPVLQITYIGYQPRELMASYGHAITILLTRQEKQLEEVVVNTGYQQVNRERMTGSVDVLDNKMIVRSVTTSVLDRMENLVPGLVFNHGDAAATDPLLVRGRSTLFANAAPLIVLDNFPYDGDISGINPSDVESITVLKDAAAASIWGARAGNGVIVITTKHGKTDKPQISVNMTVTGQPRPDLSSVRTIAPADYTSLEQYLFNQGYYAAIPGGAGHPALTPIVELLFAKANGTLPATTADAQIAALANQDVKPDISRYLYRENWNQQYALSVSGRTTGVNYYLSGGFDHDLAAPVGKSYNRLSLRSENTFRLSQQLQADAGIQFIQSINQNGNNPGYNYISPLSGKHFYPYARLVNAAGIAQPVNLDYRRSYIDTAGAGSLLDWSWNPIQDIAAETNKTTTRDYLVNSGLTYHPLQDLFFTVKYQYENQLINGSDIHNSNSYYTRNLINSFSQRNSSTGAISNPIPLGGIDDLRFTEIISHQARAQLNYSHNARSGRFNIIGGAEIKSVITSSNNYRMYGYQPDKSLVYTTIDFTTYFKQYYNPLLSAQITNAAGISQTVDHFISYYSNASYEWKSRYTISASAREDQANLFGVKTNQKGTPLWSAGLAWKIDKEAFYKCTWLPALKLRASYGHNGNISRLASAYTTASFYGAAYSSNIAATILNPPNNHLRWEQVGIFNAGLDFSFRRELLSGTIEYYRKNAQDLMGQSPVDPTLGLANNAGGNFFYGNVAAMKGSGWDIQVNSRNLQRVFSWTTHLLFSFTNSHVTQYSMPVSAAGSTYLTIAGYSINPVLGRPVFSVYSYPWRGLDPANGDPIGYLNGGTSKNYASINTNTLLDSMVCNGPAQPLYTAALRNDFAYKNWSLSVNISYKGGNYFRRPSISYSDLFANWSGNADYARRWQHAGDELYTHVPSLVYPANAARDVFYANSAVLVEKADNIRLEDVVLAYEWRQKSATKGPFSSLRFYLYAANFGPLWTAAHDHIDPYYNNIPTDRLKLSVGVTAQF